MSEDTHGTVTVHVYHAMHHAVTRPRMAFEPGLSIGGSRYGLRQSAHIGAWGIAAILAACGLEARDPIPMDNLG